MMRTLRALRLRERETPADIQKAETEESEEVAGEAADGVEGEDLDLDQTQDEPQDTPQDEPLRPSPEAERVGDLLKITGRMTDLLQREVEMLRATRPAAMQALQEQKGVLAAAYEAQLKTLRDSPEILEEVSEALRDDLRQATERFHAVLAENERALRAAKEATDKLLQGLIQAVEDQRQPCAAYSLSGQETPENRRPAISLAFNQKL